MRANLKLLSAVNCLLVTLRMISFYMSGMPVGSLMKTGPCICSDERLVSRGGLPTQQNEL